MSGISLSGLASGLDWKSLVSQLIAAERVPENALRLQQAQNTQRIDAFASIKSKLMDLQTSAIALTSNTVFLSRAASFADTTSNWSVTATPGAEVGSHTFDVLALATKAKRIGMADAGAALSATGDVSGVTIATMNVSTAVTPGIFTVNGAQVTIASTDSLQDVFDKISTATGGAVTASYDPGSDEIQLSSGREIVLGSPNDTSNFLAATKLFNNGTGAVGSSSALGVVSTSASLANAHLKVPVTAVDADGNGAFTINGVQISYNVNTESVQNILRKINESSAGVTASYDKLTDKFTLASNTTGDVGMSISEGSGGLLEALGLNSTASFVHGQNASVQVDGGATLTSTSNTFDEALTGVTGLSVTATSTGTQTVNVTSDTSSAKAKIQDFVAKYNAIQSFIDDQTKTTSTDSSVSTSTLSGNRDVASLASSLRSLIFNAVPGLTGTVQRLEGLGIDFTGTSSQLSVVDESKLDQALQDQPDKVQALFNGTDGLVGSLKSFINSSTGASGLIATETSRYTDDSSRIDLQIASMERRISQEQDRLTASFIAMEQAQSQIQQQSTALINAFGSSSSGTSSK